MSDAINKPAHYNQGSIECIDAMKIVLTPEEFRGYLKGNVFKYLWREKDKNGNEDLRKGKDYYDRLIRSFDESEDQPIIKQSSTTEPPDGWRWIERGELIRKGDKPKNGDAVPLLWIGTPCCGKEFILRRNRFEVGEKVVTTSNGNTAIVLRLVNRDLYEVRHDFSVCLHIHAGDLAPYIEDAK